jgi:prepilin-type N-terminal cleavage/methylation domain-containing protein
VSLRRSVAQFTRRGGSLRPAFTLVELLVVIVVISILIALLAMAGAKLHHSHKVKATEAIIKNVRMAIEEFVQANPLGAIYDSKDATKRTFGPYPPYQLANAGSGVAYALEVAHPLTPSPGFPGSLTERVARDLSGFAGPGLNYADWARLNETDPNDENNDVRGLYTYLKLYVPDTLSSLPKDALKPLTSTSEFVNPTGTGPAPGQRDSSWVDVLGIHDAWGVPLNYFLYVKLEWTMSPTGTPMWAVTDRIPVVMSDGHEKEVHEAEPQGEQHELEQWILSDPLPSPVATVNNLDGSLPSEGSSQYAGWARAKAAGEEYEYVP